jgi:hypothetical protein
MLRGLFEGLLTAKRHERVETDLRVDVVSGFGLVEDELGVRRVAKSREIHGRAHQVAGELAAFAEASAGQGGAPPCRRDCSDTFLFITPTLSAQYGIPNPCRDNVSPWRMGQ